MLAVTDEEIQYFKKDITDFTNIEKQIKELKAKMKPYQDKIRELSKLKETKKEEVINFMDCNKLDMCNTDDASYEMKETKSHHLSAPKSLVATPANLRRRKRPDLHPSALQVGRHADRVPGRHARRLRREEPGAHPQAPRDCASTREWW